MVVSSSNEDPSPTLDGSALAGAGSWPKCDDRTVYISQPQENVELVAITLVFDVGAAPFLQPGQVAPATAESQDLQSGFTKPNTQKHRSSPSRFPPRHSYAWTRCDAWRPGVCQQVFPCAFLMRSPHRGRADRVGGRPGGAEGGGPGGRGGEGRGWGGGGGGEEGAVSADSLRGRR